MSEPAKKKQKTGENALEQLKKVTVVVADTGDFDAVKKYQPVDVTTNPSLIYAAAQMPQYSHVMDDCIAYAKKNGKTAEEQLTVAVDRLAVAFGYQSLQLVQGRVSTEIDARLSYDRDATIAKCRVLQKYYKEMGVDYKKRVLFKIASTWEGIRAADILEKEDGVHCNLTLLFSFAQAVACAEAGVTLISPFVGRILDFWKKETGKTSYPSHEDPGVVSVTQIYNYYKKHGYNTIVMGASFRSKEEIFELAGCDNLTISPKILDALIASDVTLDRKLDAAKAKQMDIPKVTFDEKSFRWEMCQDACATAKLAEGIRNFAKDIVKLEDFVRAKM